MAQAWAVRELMRLILIRHGETAHNKDRLTLGRFDAPLNQRGRAQARALAGSFRRRPDAIYTSPLLRAAETAEIIGEAVGRTVQHEQALIEMDVGEMEHLSRGELRDRYPDFIRQWLSAGAADARMPGGETLVEVQERAWSAIGRLVATHPQGSVVAVSHNFVILTVLCKALNLPLGEFRYLRQSLATRTILDISGSHATLLQLNDDAHLLAAGLGDDAAESEAPR